jgi:RIO kinase 1
VHVPEAVILRGHVLVMEFVGENGWPSPKLKDVDLTYAKAAELYSDCVMMMRNMYQDCKLVHADLSEFNILYHKGKNGSVRFGILLFYFFCTTSLV